METHGSDRERRRQAIREAAERNAGTARRATGRARGGNTERPTPRPTSRPAPRRGSTGSRTPESRAPEAPQPSSAASIREGIRRTAQQSYAQRELPEEPGLVRADATDRTPYRGMTRAERAIEVEAPARRSNPAAYGIEASDARPDAFEAQVVRSIGRDSDDPLVQGTAEQIAGGLDASAEVEIASRRRKILNRLRAVTRGAAQVAPDALAFTAGVSDVLGADESAGRILERSRSWEDALDQAIGPEAAFREADVYTQAGESLGSTLPYFAAGAGAAALGRSTKAATAFTGAVQNGGATYEEAMRMGATPEEAAMALLAGTAIGAGEAIPISRAFGRADRLSGGFVRRAMRQAVQEGAEEAVQETLALFANDTVARALYDEDRAIGAALAETAAMGGGIGALMGVLTTIAGPGRPRRPGRFDPTPSGEELRGAFASGADPAGRGIDAFLDEIVGASSGGDPSLREAFAEGAGMGRAPGRQGAVTPEGEALAPEDSGQVPAWLEQMVANGATPGWLLDMTRGSEAPASMRGFDPTSPDEQSTERSPDPDVPVGERAEAAGEAGAPPERGDAAGSALEAAATATGDTAAVSGADGDSSPAEGAAGDVSGEGGASEYGLDNPPPFDEWTRQLEQEDGDRPTRTGPAGPRRIQKGAIEVPEFLRRMDAPEADAPKADAPEASGDESAAEASGESRVETMRLRSIEADPDRFQPRDAEYSEESVERIVNNFDERELDPLRTWRDPQDGKTYVLAGHSRREAIRRLQEKGELPEDYEVPIDPYEGTEAEARDFAGRENNSRTAQTPSEDAAALRIATEGMSRTEAREEARMRYGRNGSLVYALSKLSPTGKVVQDLRAFGKARTKEARDVLTMAQWMGLARDRYDALTDSHERELYDWLRSRWGKRGAPRTQADWLQYVDEVVGRRSFMGEFDATQPLNLSELPADTQAEINAAIEEADTELKQAQRERRKKEKEFTERGATGDELRRVMQPFDEAVRAAQRKALQVREEAGRARGEAKKQMGLFGGAPEASGADSRGEGDRRTIDTNTTAETDDAATAGAPEGDGLRTEGDADGVGAVDPGSAGRPAGGGDGAPGAGAAGGDAPGVGSGTRPDSGEQGGAGLSADDATAPGAEGDRGVSADTSDAGAGATTAGEPGRGGVSGETGAGSDASGGASPLLDPAAAPTDVNERDSGLDLDGAPRRDGLEPTTKDAPEASGDGVATVEERRRQQEDADAHSKKKGVALGDEADVRRSLPMLLDEQQGDVVKAERRFFGTVTETERAAGEHLEDPRRGILFTNATGTGKTYTGLGIVKRHVLAGKTDVLIVVPTDQKAKDWIEDGRNLALDVTQLESTKDAGEGVVVTTYANMGQNNALLYARTFDLVVYDESHRLMQSEDGSNTAAFEAHRFLTNHPEHALRRVANSDPDVWAALEAWQKAKRELRKIHPRERREKSPRYLAAAQAEADTRESYIALYEPQTKLDSVKEAAAEAIERSRAVFLSATPFAYHKTLRYGDGYLYTSPVDKERLGEYNQAQGFSLFLQRHLAYHMHTGQLRAPGPEVDTSLMERDLHQLFEQAGAVSGRALEMDADYSRDFFQVESQVGEKIDEGMQFLWGNTDLQEYGAAIRSRFGYLYRTQLLESIKARESVSRVKEHLALGRKVVVFHTYNENTPVHPFRITAREAAAAQYNDMDRRDFEKLEQQIESFRKQRPDLWNLDLSGLLPVQDVYRSEFGDQVAMFNGTVSKRLRGEHVREFNEDGSGLDVLVVQIEAGKEGISLHDRTGTHQRVVMNLGLPTRPTDAIQSEGRVYRFGNKTDAIFEYPVTGLAFERDTFGLKVATRSKTAENLALGHAARDLEVAFRDGYANATDQPPGPHQGTGGKEADRFRDTSTPFDKAKTLYYARGKTSKKNKSRDGVDYYATPEPIGQKMVEWLQLGRGDRFLEPSAGHGAIARFVPEGTSSTLIEPSYRLAAQLRLNTNGNVGTSPFENLHLVNKYEGIAMNPPYGSGGKTAMEHVAKAAKHLAPGGRLVAIVPDGPSMAKRLAKWAESKEGERVVKVADVGLPSVTFKRAATTVRTRVLVFDRPWSEEDRPMIETRGTRDLAADTIEELFDRIENVTMPDRRPKPPEPPKTGDFEFETITPSGDASVGTYRDVSADTSPEASGGNDPDGNDPGQSDPREDAAASLAPATLEVTIEGRTYAQELGGLDAIQTVEMPELVRLARGLMGDVPHMGTGRMDANGLFKTVGVDVPSGAAQDVDARGGSRTASAQIRIQPELFRDSTKAAQVLAHEIGHLVDYVPEETMKRGNLGGRLRALLGYMKSTVERAGDRSEPALDQAARRKLSGEARRSVLSREGHTAKQYRESKELRQRLAEPIREAYRALLDAETKRRNLIDVPTLTAELWTFSQYWRPVPDGADAAFLQYRKSSRELYADAIGGLLIAPTELKKRAPLFYQAFFEGLETDKADVAQAYEEIQLLLARGPKAVAQSRMEDVYGMFSDAERRKTLLEEAKKAQRKKEYRTQIVQSLVTRWHPILERARRLERAGTPLAEDPRYLLEEVGMADSPASLYLADVAEQVLEPLKVAGLTDRDLAAYMFLNRVENERTVRVAEDQLSDEVKDALAGTGLLARDVQPAELEDLPEEIRAIVQAAAENAGGRASMANPLGFTDETAKATREHLEAMLGGDRARALRRAQRVFVDLTTPILDEAAELGVLNKEWWVTAGKPNRYAYATFRVLDFVDDPVRVGVAVKQQRGTFRDVDDVFGATMGKALATIRENVRQRAKLAVKDMMATHFADEWEKPKPSAPGRYAPPKKRGLRGVLYIWENGRQRPYYTDAYVADSFRQMDLSSLRWVSAAFRVLNAPFRAGYITYNLTFGLWTNPIRDARRAAKAVAIKGRKASYRQVVRRYLTESRAAWRYARGRVNDPLVRELLASGAVMPPGESVMFVDRGDGLRKTAERYGMAPPKDRNRLLSMVQRLGASIRLVNRYTEALPKFATWKILEDQGIDGRERAWRVRTQVGTPNVTDGGRAKELTNSVFMFSNVFTQGWRSDAQLATRPETRGGYVFRTIMLDVVPKLAMKLAATGMMAKAIAAALGVDEDDEDANFGAWLKTFYDHVGSYDMGSYLVVPLGYAEDPSSPSGKKARYLRIPHDESARAVVGAMWRLFEDEPDALAALGSAFDFGGGQVPGFAPAIGLGDTWADYLGGGNPRDDFYGRDILTRRAHEARQAGDHGPALVEMLGHTVDEFGVTRFRWKDKEGVNAVPFVNRVVKESMWGLIEEDRNEEDRETGRKASVRLGYDQATQERYREMYRLRRDGEETREQQGTEELYRRLLHWHRSAYRYYDEMAIQARTEGDDAGERQARRALEAATSEYFSDQ